MQIYSDGQTYHAQTQTRGKLGATKHQLAATNGVLAQKQEELDKTASTLSNAHQVIWQRISLLTTNLVRTSACTAALNHACPPTTPACTHCLGVHARYTPQTETNRELAATKGALATTNARLAQTREELGSTTVSLTAVTQTTRQRIAQLTTDLVGVGIAWQRGWLCAS